MDKERMTVWQSDRLTELQSYSGTQSDRVREWQSDFVTEEFYFVTDIA